jgi:hypothetical protein
MDGTRKKSDDPSAESFTVRDRPDAPDSPASATPFTPGMVLAERYELRRILGRGGMGVVFEAYDRILAEPIAIKIVRTEYAGERAWAERLAREVKLARQINHPNVCRVFDFGQADAHPFLIMELAGHGTLRDEIVRGEVGARPLEGRLSDARTLAAGLAAIHEAGIVHRDIAPQNALRMDDGRLVLSDFGMAVDNFDASSSIHGGTVAYMAPEVIRGGRASFASDIWSLGIVIHEAVFGVRPNWSADGREIQEPALGRLLTPQEQQVLSACRACTDVSPRQRPRSARLIAGMLTGRSLPGWRRRLTRLAGASAALLLAVLVMRMVGHRLVVRSVPTRDAVSLLPHGDVSDWSTPARVLATVPGRVHCMVLLPDRKTVRFVWGIPKRAEDLDTETGRREPSRLVPAAYAEGCPDMSRDGSRLVFAGHDKDRRPVAFVSSRPDGADAIPVVATGEPSLLTDPAWLSDNHSFLYALDLNHSAIYSMPSRSNVVVPADTALGYSTAYWAVGDALLVAKEFADGSTDLRRLRFPHLEEDLRVRVSAILGDVATPDARHYYFAGRVGTTVRFLVVDAARSTIENSGSIPDRFLRHPVFTARGLAFAAIAPRSVLRFTSAAGDTRDLAAPQGLWSASACGETLVGARSGRDDLELVRLDRSGRFLERLAAGPSPRVPQCSRDGQVLYYAEGVESQSLVRCDRGACRNIYSGMLDGFSVSSDDERIVIVAVGNDGLTVRWLRSDGQGPVHDIVATQIPCTPGWSSAEKVWVSTRDGADIVWKEIAIDTLKPTGATARGQWDCMDGARDPASPVHEPVQVVWKRQSEIRFISSADLAGR